MVFLAIPITMVLTERVIMTARRQTGPISMDVEAVLRIFFLIL